MRFILFISILILLSACAAKQQAGQMKLSGTYKAHFRFMSKIKIHIVNDSVARVKVVFLGRRPLGANHFTHRSNYHISSDTLFVQGPEYIECTYDTIPTYDPTTGEEIYAILREDTLRQDDRKYFIENKDRLRTDDGKYYYKKKLIDYILPWSRKKQSPW